MNQGADHGLCYVGVEGPNYRFEIVVKRRFYLHFIPL